MNDATQDQGRSPTMDTLHIIGKFRTAHDAYFKLLLDTYPTKAPITDSSKLGAPQSCTLATEVQACLVALGPTAQQRMLRLGFDLLYPFNNIVDQYNWRASIIAQNTNFTTFASIAIRIDAELQLIENVLEFSQFSDYQGIPSDLFAESKARYTSPDDGLEATAPTADGDPKRIRNDADSEAVKGLQKIERQTNIFSNIANVATTVKTLLGI
ncbi:hypothetical protein [Pseudomonas muyukensis]|uniref:Uncharacterized protein n=1 Tax=Pseudomonas muyukensis TaxID=2842357 RepID=A0ABX8M8M0_9PSED|nr:hypothetical protein [Pseudomonas muyukensis]QXH35436.1 hypothetical protein KSS95_01000 [Pseudomonas muyukensis]